MMFFNRLRKTGKVLFVLLSALFTLATSAMLYLHITFPTARMEEIAFQLQAPIGQLNISILKPVFLYFLIPLLVQLLVHYLLAKKLNCHKVFYPIVLMAILLAQTFFCTKIALIHGAPAFIKNNIITSDFIVKNYIDPRNVKLTFPKRKRNFIHIYLEGIENTCADKKVGGGFKTNIIPGLTEIALKNESFAGDKRTLHGARPLLGSTWTMGATFATEAGLPLKIKLRKNEMSSQKHFFKDVKTLGNILQENGYRTVLIKGIDTTFAGTNIFYREHGNYLIMDHPYSQKHHLIPTNYKVWWGYEDEKLFAITKQKLLDLASDPERPFALTIYTNDTHPINGLVCRKCKNDYPDQYSNVIACSSRQIKEFVDWLQRQEFWSNTTILIHGDHITMNPGFKQKISSKKYYRTVFTSFLNSPAKKTITKRRDYSTFDLFPTILASLNVRIQGDRLGLGVNLYSKKATLLEKLGEKKFNRLLAYRSIFMENLAQIRTTLTDTRLFDTQNVNSFLRSLQPMVNNERYVIAIGIREAGTRGLSPESVILLKQLGLKTDFKARNTWSFAALINNGHVLEKADVTAIELFQKIGSDRFVVKSANHSSGNYCSIQINGVEYAPNLRGMNFVVYDKERKWVVASQRYDTHVSSAQ